jgi:hypothetical protein
MEVVELARVARTELVVENGVVVEAAEGVLTAEVRENLVDRLLARKNRLAIGFRVRG